MTDPALPEDEDVESTMLGSRRAAPGADDVDLESTMLGSRRSSAAPDESEADDLEATMLGSRRSPAAALEASAPDDLEATMLGTRRSSAAPDESEPDDLEATMLGIRRATQRRGIRSVSHAPGVGGADRGDAAPAAEPELELDELTTFQVGADPSASAAAHVDDRTMLSSRRLPTAARAVPTTTDAIELDPEATVYDVRHGGTGAVDLPPGAHEDTLLTPRRSAAAAEERERTNPGFHQIPVDETAITPRIRRTPADAPLSDSPVRPAHVPDAAGPRERYGAREIPQAAVFRTAPQPRVQQAPADGARAATQQRARGRRRLVTMLVVTGVLVAVAVAAVVVLAITSF